MALLRFLPDNLTIPFMKGKGIASSFSGILIAGSILFWLFVGLNTGIDFRGGFVIEVKTLEGAANVEALREELSDLELGDISLQEFGSEREVLIRVQSQDEGLATNLSDANKQAIQLIQDQIADRYEIRRTEFVGAVVGDELKQNAIYAVIAAWDQSWSISGSVLNGRLPYLLFLLWLMILSRPLVICLDGN